MAVGINLGTVSMNAKEVPEFGQFIHERTFEQPLLNAIHKVWTGIQMKEQIILASKLGKTGIKDTACARPTTGAKSLLTEKFWDPVLVGDTIIHCQKEINPLFKAYYNKVKEYRDLFEIEGSDEQVFITALLTESAMQSVMRLVWYGDTEVAVAVDADAGPPAVVAVPGVGATDIKFYNPLDGLWKQIFTGVTATNIAKVTIAANAQVTKALQYSALADDATVDLFTNMHSEADVRLRNHSEATFLVSGQLYFNYIASLTKQGANFSLQYTMEGFESVRWNGYRVVNMETVWDLANEDFTSDLTGAAYHLPNRAVFTIPENIPVGTLNENDMDTAEFFYDQVTRLNYFAYGYTLDAKVLEEYMIVAAY